MQGVTFFMACFMEGWGRNFAKWSWERGRARELWVGRVWRM